MNIIFSSLAYADDEYDYDRLIVGVYNSSNAKGCWMPNKAFASHLKSKLGKSNFILEVFPHKGMNDSAYPDTEVGILLVNTKDRDSSIDMSTRIHGRQIEFGIFATDSITNDAGGYIMVRYWIKGVHGADTKACEDDYFSNMEN